MFSFQGLTPRQATGSRDAARAHEAYEVIGSVNGEHYGLLNNSKSKGGSGNDLNVDVKQDPLDQL